MIFTLGCYVNGCTDCSDNKSSCKKCANDKALLISSYNTKCVSECPLNYDKVDTEGDLKCVIKVVTTRPPPTTKMALKSMTIQTKSKAWTYKIYKLSSNHSSSWNSTFLQIDVKLVLGCDQWVMTETLARLIFLRFFLIVVVPKGCEDKECTVCTNEFIKFVSPEGSWERCVVECPLGYTNVSSICLGR